MGFTRERTGGERQLQHTVPVERVDVTIWARRNWYLKLYRSLGKLEGGGGWGGWWFLLKYEMETHTFIIEYIFHFDPSTFDPSTFVQKIVNQIAEYQSL